MLIANNYWNTIHIYILFSKKEVANSPVYIKKKELDKIVRYFEKNGACQHDNE